MKLDELFDQRFPHACFHDAEIEKISLDYARLEAVFECAICVGDPEAPEVESREVRQRGRLIFTGLLYSVIEPPDDSYPFREAGSLWLSDHGPAGREQVSSTRLPQPLPEGAIAHWFFIGDWNAFIHIAAEAARFEWASD
jgi:hypothetical protein